MKKRQLAAGLLAAAAIPFRSARAQAPRASAPAAPAAAGHGAHDTVQADALRWVAPPAYARGAQFAVVRGDPTKEGLYVVRLKVPAGFRIAPHTHPNDENVTVLSGAFHIGIGPQLNQAAATKVLPGGFAFVERGMTHFALFSEDTVIQLHGMGPQGITYVNPADDPRRQ